MAIIDNLCSNRVPIRDDFGCILAPCTVKLNMYQHVPEITNQPTEPTRTELLSASQQEHTHLVQTRQGGSWGDGELSRQVPYRPPWINLHVQCRDSRGVGLVSPVHVVEQRLPLLLHNCIAESVVVVVDFEVAMKKLR